MEALLPNYALTLGNSLRRVLLSSISGLAVVSFKAEGASHEFTTLPGVKEDLVEIMLNLKALRFKAPEDFRNINSESESDTLIRLSLNKTGSGPVLGKDISPHPDIEVVNPDHLIATLDAPSDKIALELVIDWGLGYLSIEESEAQYGQNDYISIDAVFCPVSRVRYKVENTRVGKMTNLDRLLLTIETDGSMTPKNAFEEAAAILKEHYAILSGATEVDSQSFRQSSEDKALQDAVRADERLDYYIEDLQLSARTTNALINNDLHTVQDILNLSDAELRDLRGFGAIALQEIKDKMKELGF
ncbi:MAG: DNA-directed RNA polymerase subunit alpha [Candidatus Saccharibacteria bacterium]|nr:DNA-directed RNA polymerase subunit alpha [Candidatus Saccharibacteria bacterium]